MHQQFLRPSRGDVLESEVLAIGQDAGLLLRVFVHDLCRFPDVLELLGEFDAPPLGAF